MPAETYQLKYKGEGVRLMSAASVAVSSARLSAASDWLH